MNQAPRPPDIDPQSGNRLPLPARDGLDDAGQRVYDQLANPVGGSLAGLQGPGGIRLHSPALSACLRPANLYLRDRAGIDSRWREVAILTTAREHDCRFEWAAHEPEARRVGVSDDVIDAIRTRGPVDGLDDRSAAIIAFGRELFGRRQVSPETYRRLADGLERRLLVDLVHLMGMYAMTAATLIAFDAQLPADAEPDLPS